jgi:hypothetical protein
MLAGLFVEFHGSAKLRRSILGVMYMNANRKYLPVLLCLSLSCTISTCSPAIKAPRKSALSSRGITNKRKAELEVFPEAARKLSPVELSEFVADVLPKNGIEGFDWDYFSSGPIEWITDGYSNSGGETTQRVGLVRIRVGGVPSTVLRKREQELAWSLSFVTDSEPKFGPEYIRIEPGFDDAQLVGLDSTDGQPGICFGALFNGCDFKIAEALASHRIKYKKLCEGDVNLSPDVYEIKVEKKSPALLAYFSSGGSGGASAAIELHSLKDREVLCQKQR